MTIVSSFFIIVLGASLFLGAVMVVGTFRSGDPSSELTSNGRAGRIARTLRDGTLCHYMVFDNKTAQTELAVATKASPSPNRKNR